MRIYTKEGDQGNTTLLRGGRVSKDHIRVAAYGDVDELNALIGLVRSAEPTDFEPQMLDDIQRDLLTIGSLLAMDNAEPAGKTTNKLVLEENRITALEDAIDGAASAMLPLECFVLPGGTQKAALIHHARTVCRRAERSLVSLDREDSVPNCVLPYMNRLSDLLFTLARLANFRAGVSDREW